MLQISIISKITSQNINHFALNLSKNGKFNSNLRFNN